MMAVPFPENSCAGHLTSAPRLQWDAADWRKESAAYAYWAFALVFATETTLIFIRAGTLKRFLNSRFCV
jgi:hypothetical protein